MKTLAQFILNENLGSEDQTPAWLIEKLKKLPKNYRVCYRGEDGDAIEITNIKVSRKNKQIIFE